MLACVLAGLREPAYLIMLEETAITQQPEADDTAAPPNSSKPSVLENL